MIVSKDIVSDVLEYIKKDTDTVSFDTETYGVKIRDKLFSIAIGANDKSFYFSFNELQENCLDRRLIIDIVNALQGKIVYGHNIKFDLQKLVLEGISFEYISSFFYIRDTMIIANIINNTNKQYSLDALSEKYLLERKIDLKNVIEEKKYYTKNENGEKNYRYDLVPLSIISEYAERDAFLTLKLGKKLYSILEEISKEIATLSKNTPMDVFKNEMEVIFTVAKMEMSGIKIDIDFCKQMLLKRKEELKNAEEEFCNSSGFVFDNKKDTIENALKKENIKLECTINGNIATDKNVLSRYANSSIVARSISTIREIQKDIAILEGYISDVVDGNIHSNFITSCTNTGRMSCRNPNLQNIKKDEDGSFSLRKAFVARDGYFFAKIDYSQQEYRMMIDYAGQKDIIEKILAGEDIHEAVARSIGIKRSEAKTLNFAMLYGAGIKRISEKLKISESEAKKFKEEYFAKLPKVKRFIDSVKETGKRRGYVFNWLGRVLKVDDEAYYKLPNYLIQGGCADVVKVAMNRVSKYLEKYRSRPILQIHDELVFEIHNEEEDVIQEIIKIMENVYIPRNGLYLKVDCSRNRWLSEEGDY